MKAIVKLITPKMSDDMLCRSENFRSRSAKYVNRIADDISNGRWDMNGETIKILGHNWDDGTLDDGQHRLAAIRQSGISVRALVVFLDEPSGIHVDTGKARKLSDWVRHRGIKNAISIAAVSKQVLCHIDKRWDIFSFSNTVFDSKRHLQFCIDNEQNLRSAICMAGRAAKKPLVLNKSTLAAILYLGSAGNNVQESQLANWFSEKLQSGEELNANEPVFVLRNIILKNSQSSLNRWAPFQQRAIITMAWNKTVSGTTCRILKFSATGPAKQKIPFVINEGE